MKEYFIVSDIHSFYSFLMNALQENGWNNSKDQVFVSLGDLLDRGPETIKCLQFVNELPNDRKILIRGNHEDLMEMIFRKGYFETHDISNGTVKSCIHIAEYESQLKGVKEFYVDETSKLIDYVRNSSLWNNYVSCLKDYAELGDNIFVHGWIPVNNSMVTGCTKNPEWREASELQWDNARWYNGMDLWSRGIREEGKIIWCGHWHTSWGHANLHHEGVQFPNGSGEKAHFSPFEDEGIIAMDGCTVFSSKVNCKVIKL